MEITVPHHFSPRPYQLNLLRAMDSGIKRAVVIWHRRSGKEKTCLNLVIKKMLERVGTYYYFFPTFSQGKRILWDGLDRDGFKFLDHFPAELVANKNDTELKIKLKNGSVFQLIGTDNIDSIVGTNPIGCVFSEYSLQSPRAWDFMRPILAENGGWAIFNFTPRGRNHGWKILQQAKDSEKWFWEVLSVDKTGAIPQEVLDQESKEMPQDLFRQEYFCEFLEDAGAVFRGIDKTIYQGDIPVDRDRVYRLGVDLAKFRDFTSITPFDLTTFKVGRPQRFNQIDYNVQKANIEAVYYKYNKGLIWIDSTGVGEPIYDDLNAKGLKVNPYHFTESSRKDLLINLQIKIEQGIIRLPDDEILLSELKSVHYELSDTGKVKMVVPEGLHDDTVMSTALAVWEIPTKPVIIKSQEERDLLKQFDAHRKLNKPVGRL